MSRSPLVATPFDGYSSGVKALVRTGRHGRDGVEFSKPFEASLLLARTREGHTCGLSVVGEEFAEFDPRYDVERPGLLQVEDYTLEILEFRA